MDWRAVEDDVRRLRQRIFTATQEGDLKKVRNLQKLMLRSLVEHAVERAAGDAAQRWSHDGRCRRQGGAVSRRSGWRLVRRTMLGPDGQPGQAGVHPEGQRKAASARHSGDLDRAMQARVRNALEPEWEARFEPKILRVSAGPAAMMRSRPSTRPSRARTRSGYGFSTRTWRRRSTGSTTTSFSASSARSPAGN